MSLVRALVLMSENKVVHHKDANYTIIDGRMCWVVLEEENTVITHWDFVHNDLYLMEMLFDNFYPNQVNVFDRPALPEKVSIVDQLLYDFSDIPEHLCPVCIKWIDPMTALREGRYAHCPGCHRKFFKAPRLDGQKDVIETDAREQKSVWGRPKKKEVREPNIEKLAEHGTVYKRKIRILT